MSIQSVTGRLASRAFRPAASKRACYSRCLHSSPANHNTSPIVKPALFGQPSPPSHPHLLKPKEVTPGITKDEYRARRQRLIDSLDDETPVVVCLSSTVKYSSGEIFYRFRQSSDLWYLTGFQEPESAIIIERTPNSHKTTLFLRSKDPHRELWDGPRTGPDVAPDLLGVDEAYDITDFPLHLKTVLQASSAVYASDPQRDWASKSRRKRSWSHYFSKGLANSAETFDAVMHEVQTRCPKSIRPLSPRVLGLRTIKSQAEQRLMKAAGDLSGNAHAKTMCFTDVGKSESDLAAHFEYMCALGGSERPAYVPVVASGANALMIHYTANDQRLLDGEMVLVDAGCELHGYASDITRTWPVSGTFTQPQKDLYQVRLTNDLRQNQAVLNTLKACTSKCRESEGITMFDLHRTSIETLRAELKQIGFSSDLSINSVERLYPHFVSHPIGIDLHESSDGRCTPLKEGMVITVEPGVYVPPDSEYPVAFHNMGIRLEDDILVQKNHPFRLTANAPLEIPDVEGACQNSLGNGPY